MNTEVTVSCASCGGDVDVTVDSEGGVSNAHYGGVMIVDEERVVDGATTVDNLLDTEVETGKRAVIYTECVDCCPKCSAS